MRCHCEWVPWGHDLATPLPGARFGLVETPNNHGEQLLNLLVTNKIGIKAEQYGVFSIDDDWWGDIVGTVVDAQGANALQSVSEAVPVVSFPIHIEAAAKGITFAAELLDTSGAVQMNGVLYGSPSKAGQVATGWKSCNGWMLWRYLHPETGEWRVINELRNM